jgi:golgin subfamily A member 4
MLSKAEELFSTNNLSQKINLRELEQMSRIDENLLKDKFVKDCVGDHQQLLRKINKEEKEKKQKKLKPGYNADFDLDLLDENEQVVTRKVLKTIKRKDSTTGEWIEE